jgi:tRNA(His) 5'-end guanylyltransferase
LLRPTPHKKREIYADVRVPEGGWIVLRLDGKGFSAYTDKYERPHDERFHAYMVDAARAQFDAFQNTPLLVSTHSDEISVVMPRDFDLFERRVEKLVSVGASIAASAFSVGSGDVVAFDGRVVVQPSRTAVLDYLKWRQEDCWRCFLNSLAYWTARDRGMTVREATKIAGALPRDKHDYLHSVGVNPTERPLWERRGTVLYRKQVAHTGFNPITQQEVPTTRLRVVSVPPPYGEEFRTFTEGLVSA